MRARRFFLQFGCRRGLRQTTQKQKKLLNNRTLILKTDCPFMGRLQTHPDMTQARGAARPGLPAFSPGLSCLPENCSTEPRRTPRSSPRLPPNPISVNTRAM